MENILEIKSLNKSFDDFSLRDINISLPKGVIMGLVGENGSGKTSIIKSILNIVKKDSGNIKLFGMDHIENELDVKKDIGVIMDEIGFNNFFTANDIELILKNIYEDWNSSKFNYYLDKFKLPRNKQIKDFSKGMKMKLSMSITLSKNAKLLILDEPTSGLDPIVRSEILDELLEFVQDEEHSILFSSHITSDLDKIADYITLIHNGRTIFTKDILDINENFAIIQGNKEDLDNLNSKYIVSTIHDNFSSKALTDNKTYFENKENFVIDKANIEDIMMFYIRSEN